jgi:hypothetical protein
MPRDLSVPPHETNALTISLIARSPPNFAGSL